MTKDKTITWAIVGETVVASSSAKLLDRAIAGLSSHENGLATDPRWTSTQKNLMSGSQVLTTFSIARIAEGIENTVRTEKMDKDGAKTFKDVIDALKTLSEPFSIQSKMSGGEMNTHLFIPMDYDKLLDLLGRAMKEHSN